MNDYYLILGINSNATIDEIKAAYVEKIRFYHPDRWQNDPNMRQKAEENSKQINEAYDVLKDPVKRANYDKDRGYSQKGYNHQTQNEHERQKREQEARARAEAERRQREQAEAQRREQEAKARADRESAERAKREKAERVAARKVAITKLFAKVMPSFRIVAVIAVIVGLLWAGSRVIPQFIALIPTVKATATQRLVVNITLISSPVVPTETTRPTPTSTKTHTPVPVALPTEITDAKGATMVLVPDEDFTMGSDTGEDDEKPIHSVHLGSFYIDKYEVTNALYKDCVSVSICEPPSMASSRTHSDYYGNSEFDNYPVIYVDWNMAKTYCEWRDARLPTEAEWEKAARGVDGRTYPWGEGFGCSKGNSYGCIGDVTKVGSYENGQSIYGVFDLSGNVWEWVGSLYKPYPYNPTDGRENLNSSGQIGLRGGSWLGKAFDNRSSNRYGANPYVYDDVGFRCARDVNP